ncbi:hypothetical protein [Methylophaga sp.]|uniref:hypothetical protein n=1 Tax=Methylophaga sp. TaxID=2024840 RepID=UPI0014015532|nr:hypothetical protein [Methylophaga sp.]MTI64066.1 hypothetical protein [Methylophaga sp.]
MRRLLTVISLLFFMLGTAQADSVHILLSEDNVAYHQLAEDIKNHIGNKTLRTTAQIHTLDSTDSKSVAPSDLIVSIGEAAVHLSKRQYPQNSHLYSFIDKKVIEADFSDNWVAVLLDQPLQLLLDTATQIVERGINNRLVIAVAEDNQLIRDEIARLSTPIGIQLDIVVVGRDEEPAKVIDSVLQNAGALIAVRDSRVWSGEHAKWMLYQSYKYKVPVVGYSKSFLKAGALISVYASLFDTVRETANLITYWHDYQGWVMQERHFYPPYSISINDNIARALEIEIPDSMRQGAATDVSD